MKKIHINVLLILFICSAHTLSANNNLTCNATAVSTPTFICNGQSSTLSAALSGPGLGGTNYTWMPSGQTGNVVSVSPTISTTYTVQVISGSDTCYAVTTVSVSTCAGTEELVLGTISIFPSIVLNEINVISNNLDYDLIEVQLINTVGEIALTTAVYSNSDKIDVSGLSRGLYIIYVRTNKTSAIYKVIMLI